MNNVLKVLTISIAFLLGLDLYACQSGEPTPVSLKNDQASIEGDFLLVVFI